MREFTLFFFKDLVNSGFAVDCHQKSSIRAEENCRRTAKPEHRTLRNHQP